MLREVAWLSVGMLREVGARVGVPHRDGDGAAASPAGPAGTATPEEVKGLLPLAEPQHSTAGSLATQQTPHLNTGQLVSHIRTRFFKPCSALQNKGKFLKGP